jgi:CubicO group peptidase (beta-lactamase class C family)
MVRTECGGAPAFLACHRPEIAPREPSHRKREPLRATPNPEHLAASDAVWHWHAEPEAAGMDRGALFEAGQALEAGRQSGQHAGAQLYVSRHGRAVLEFACGDALSGGAVAPETIMAWFSCGKPLTAIAIAWLYERGRLDLDDPVTRYVPEFRNGKERCSIRHVLTHVGGFPNGVKDSRHKGWQEVIEEICAAPAESPPGAKAAYHPSSGWYILAEVARRIDGRPIDRLIADEILAPLEMRSTRLGIPVAEQAAMGARLARIAIGRSDRPSEADEAFIDRFNSAEEIARVNPGGGMRGPARDLGRFYEMLLAKGESPTGRVLERSTVELFTACHRWGLPDQTLAKAVLPWGLGFALHGLSDLPTSASRRVFCHSGMVSSVGLGDPDRGLACVVITNGLLDPLTNARRLRAVTGAAVRACAAP